jgi:hypothetical protein
VSPATVSLRAQCLERQFHRITVVLVAINSVPCARYCISSEVAIGHNAVESAACYYYYYYHHHHHHHKNAS